MAIDPSAPPKLAQAHAVPVIENEIPAYRAISGMAIASVVLGLASAFSFADPTFLVAAVGAVAAGLLADRRVRRRPDALTGRGLAQAGVFLGLIFGLAAVTHERVDSYLRDRRINAFADEFLKTLAEGETIEAMWYKQPPAVRAGMSPKELHQKALAASKMARYEYDESVKQVEKIKAKLARGGHLHRLGIESAGYQDLQPYGSILVEVEGVPEPGSPHESNLIALVVKGEKKAATYKWFVSSLLTDRKRGEGYVPPPKPVDDGHGHGH